MILHGNYGPSAWHASRGRIARFIPRGRLVYWGGKPTRATRGDAEIPVKGVATLEAAIVVGFNVGGKPRWSMRDAVRVVLAAKRAAGLSADSTFQSQWGYYQPDTHSKTIGERGTRVILLNSYDLLPEKRFVAHVRTVAQALRVKLRQEEVIVTITKNGRVVRQWRDYTPVRGRLR